MFKSFKLAAISLSMFGLLAASSAQANCDKYDVVGTTQISPTIVLSGDGQVTLGMPNWWEDDVYACYNAFQNPAYLYYLPGCDLNGSGLVELEEVLEMYYFVLNHPTGSVPSYSYTCPTYQCLDTPEYYDPSGSDLEWIANGVCTEMNGPEGPIACPQDQHNGILADLNQILVDHDFTQVIIEDDNLGAQTFQNDPYSFLCVVPGDGAMTDSTFAQQNACYHGNSELPFDSIAKISFDWGVNVDQLLAEYTAVLQAEFGPEAVCEPNATLGDGSWGFHAETTAYPGYTQYTVKAGKTCDYYGCRCNATVEVLGDGAGNLMVLSIENNSTFSLYQGAKCEDTRFMF